MDTHLQQKHDATLAWFSQFQLGSVIRNGVIPEWFHGIISRKAAEDMLLSKPAGYFLIRVSESRIGFTLSYRAEDRCRHFMIDVLKSGQYNIVGENTNHGSLQDLVAFHRCVPILPFHDVLTAACEQVSTNKTDDTELLFSQRKPLNCTPGAFSTDVHTNTIVPLQPFTIMPPSPPQLPSRLGCGDLSDHLASTTVPTVPIQFNPPRLYPTLDAEVAKLTLQSPDTTNISRPVPLPRKKLHSTNSALQEQAPELPSRNFLLKRNEQMDSGLHHLSTSKLLPIEVQPSLNCRAPTPNQPKNQGMKSVVANLMHLKRKSHRKGRAQEEHVYAELSKVQLSSTALESRMGIEPVCEYVYEDIPGERLNAESDTSHVHSAGVPVVLTDRLPAEYLTPPPFAPGY